MILAICIPTRSSTPQPITPIKSQLIPPIMRRTQAILCNFILSILPINKAVFIIPKKNPYNRPCYWGCVLPPTRQPIGVLGFVWSALLDLNQGPQRYMNDFKVRPPGFESYRLSSLFRFFIRSYSKKSEERLQIPAPFCLSKRMR